jgi:hypothetical protein
MTTKTTKTQPGQLLCPECGQCDWLNLVDVESTFFGPAEVLLMPHAISITVERSEEERYSEDYSSLECQRFNHTISIDEIMPGARVGVSRWHSNSYTAPSRGVVITRS